MRPHDQGVRRVRSIAVAERITGGPPADPEHAPPKSQHSFGWARAAPWRGHSEIAHLVLGERVPSDPSIIASCLDALRRAGYTSVVTTAMPPGDALHFVDSGFEMRERLHLLEHDLATLPTPRPDPPRLRRAWRTDRPAVLALDHLAFDEFWRLEDHGLREALQATPAVRFRVGEPSPTSPYRRAPDRAPDPRAPDPSAPERAEASAYAITGRAGRQGYLQRIAVHPEDRRRGWGQALVLDALRWLRRHDVRRALVNTQWTNDGAVALYESCGFRQLPVGLCVLDRTL
jgi:ribosomal protein S18 acetylase RimI-like enzyme